MNIFKRYPGLQIIHAKIWTSARRAIIVVMRMQLVRTRWDHLVVVVTNHCGRVMEKSVTTLMLVGIVPVQRIHSVFRTRKL